MSDCVRCGRSYLPGEPSCTACTWPFSSEAWSATTLRVRRVTLDTNCVNAAGRNIDLNILESWAEAGHLELQRSDAMLQELSGEQRVAKAGSIPSHPGLFRFGVSAFGGSDVLAGPDMGSEIRSILFPMVRNLIARQEFDIQQLRLHIQTGGDLFVTLNKNDFITHGRQAQLRGRGIWVLLPEETVGLLRKLYGWT